MHKPLIATLLLFLLASTAAANLNDCELVQINSTHWYFETNQTDLTNGTYNYQAFANNISSDYRIIEVDIGGAPSEYIPPDPINIANTTGNFWVNHSVEHGAGNVTDSLNVSQNGTWTNGSTTLYFNASDVGAHGYSDIMFWAYNSSGFGTLSAGSISQNTTVPNNAITITNTSDWSGDAGENVYVDYDATDADSDTPTFSCNRTDLFADFSTANGTGNWTATAGTYYIDFGVSDGYGSSSNYTMTIFANMTVTLLSQTPSTIHQNSTGNFNMTWGISHNSVGLNNTTISLIWKNQHVPDGEYNYSLRMPINNRTNENGFRADRRNDSVNPLNFETNITITNNTVSEWAGADENSTRLTIMSINSTYTEVYFNGTFQDTVFPSSWYLDRTELAASTKTQYSIYKNNYAIAKIWDPESYYGHDHIVNIFFDSAPFGALSPTIDLQVLILNSSFDPVGATNIADSPHITYTHSFNSTTWLNHTYQPHTNSSYVSVYFNTSELNINLMDASYYYVALISNTQSSKPYNLNITNIPSSTNISFADTGVLWVGSAAPYTAHSYTPNIFLEAHHTNMQFKTNLYVADNDGTWNNSGVQTTNIDVSVFPPTTPDINHFHFNGIEDYDMNGTYFGTFEIGCGVATDPDGGAVTHNLTLHYANQTFVAIINNTFTDTDITHGIYADISFNSTPYYSETEEYTMKVVATDDEGATSGSWLGVNFTLLSQPPPTPTNLQNTTGNFWVNHTWEVVAMDGHLISGETDGNFNGYNLANSTWNNDTAIISGLGNGEYSSAPTIFQRNGIWYLIAGEHDGVFNGYNWTGSTWQTDTAIISGLGDVGYRSTPTVFQNNSIWYLISGETDGNFNGYNWTGSTWQTDTAIISGLGDVGYRSTPTVFQNNSIRYLISGEIGGNFTGYNWTGSAWQTDTAIISGLGDVGSDSTPTTFEKDTIRYLISGETDGNFTGYNWTGSTWQTDTAIISGLGDVGSDSTPTIFDMDVLPGYNVSADSYNVHVNDVWHNGTTDTFYNDTYTAHAWQNITIYAYNSSGRLSAIGITQDTQIPNNDPSAGSPSPYNGATGVSTTPTLQVTITDADTDTMSVRFYEQGGSQIGSTQTNIPSGSAASVVWSGRSQSTTYYWYVITNDTYSEATSTVWHFTTYTPGGGGEPPTHEVTIEDCNNRQITEGGEIYNDFNYTNDDPDVPVFTTNATEGILNSSTGIYNWTTSVGDNGTYVWWFKAQNAYGNSDTCTVTFTVSVFGTPATPTDLTHTKGDTWVNHTWNGGAHTDSFNVSINGTWYNGTTNEYYNNTGLSNDSWSNIIVWAYNSSEGLLSVSSVSENVQIASAEEEEEAAGIIFEMFALMIIFALGTMLYSFIVVDQNNYTHVLAAFVSGIVYTLSGFSAFSGVDFYGDGVLLGTDHTGWVAIFFTTLGAIIILYAVVQAYDVVQHAIKELEESP